jgi:hypothetical protein
MRRIVMLGLGMVAAGLAACGDELPTAVGGDLMGPGVRTYEVVLDAADFLVRDTTFDGIGTLNEAVFEMGAHQFEGVLDARTVFSLFRPLTASYTLNNETRVDSIAAAVGGTLTLVVDTIASRGGPVDLEVVQVTEEWHRESATWEVRKDTADVTELWEVPGGSPGPVLAAATWLSGDTLRIELDSAAVAVWDDTTAARFGGMVRVTSPDTRIFIQAMAFQFNVRPVGQDTVVPAGSLTQTKIILTPEDVAPEPGVLRVGGLPAWRSLFRFVPLMGMRIPCGPGQPPDCTLPLETATINLATLILQPVPGGPRRAEMPMRLEGRAVLEGPHVALVRAPLTPPIGPPTDTLSTTLFEAPAPDGPVHIPVTGYVRIQLNPGDDPVPSWLALTAIGERGQFGYATFAGATSPTPPRLRLLISVPDEVVVR